MLDDIHDHVASARRAITADASADAHTGCMIALIPTEEDAARLAIDGGEPADELHLTLAYLGPDASAWNDTARRDLNVFFRSVITSGEFGDWSVFTAKIFGAAHWNADGDTPSWVWSVGDTPDDDSMDHDGDALEDWHDLVSSALESTHEHPDLPAPHSPWVAHICAAYSSDDTLLPELEQRLGPVTFDRLRLSFGSDDVDIRLNQDTTTDGESARLAAGIDGTAGDAQDIPHAYVPGGPAGSCLVCELSDAHTAHDGMTAAAGALRRNPRDFETTATVDFALMDSSWKAAVDRVYVAWMTILSEQRQEMASQIRAAVDSGNLENLATLSVSTDHAVDLLVDHMKRFAIQCAREQEREADRQGVTVGPWSLEEDGSDDSVTAALRDTARSWLTRLRAYASTTAANLASRMTASARARSVIVAETGADGSAVARDVDANLADHPKSYVRQGLAAAMTMAQNTGRLAVLTQAPPGQYFASEMLDKNTCSPCRSVDGQEYSSLTAAEAAYPAGGYVNCLGGASCRGTLVTVWDAGTTASAALTEGKTMADIESLGGKPSKGTKKDKRLHENNGMTTDQPADFVSISDAPWDGAAGRFTDEQWKRATAACDGEGTVKETCFLPHHEPDGTLNRNGVHAAAQRIGSVTGRSPVSIAHAKAHLRTHYDEMGEDAPDSIAATLGDQVELALEQVAMTAASDGVLPAPETTDAGQMAPWRGPLAVEGKTTGDGREFAPGSLTWRDLPVPLRWNKEDSHGGEPHTVAVNVGRIDKIWREGDLVMGEGMLDLSTDDGQTVHNKIKGQFLRGVSIDADSIGDKDVEFVWPEGAGVDDDGEDDPLALLFATPEKILFHAGRISAATLCDIPAFAEAYIALMDDDGAVVAGGTPAGAEGGGGYKVHTVKTRGALVAHGAEWKPPAAWFADPKLSLPTGIQVTDDGRVYGHAATWGACHIGQKDVCVQPPREEAHIYYMTGEVVTAEGSRVSVGQITVGTGHAPLNMGAVPATEHYDNTGHAVADVAVGNDEHGIWVAGAIRPNAPADMIHALRAAGQVSGDWRRIGSSLRLVGLLAVNVPGFPVPKMSTRVASAATGEEVQTALVAAGRPPVVHGTTEQEEIQTAFRVVMEVLSRRVHDDA